MIFKLQRPLTTNDPAGPMMLAYNEQRTVEFLIPFDAEQHDPLFDGKLRIFVEGELNDTNHLVINDILEIENFPGLDADDHAVTISVDDPLVDHVAVELTDDDTRNIDHMNKVMERMSKRCPKCKSPNGTTLNAFDGEELRHRCTDCGHEFKDSEALPSLARLEKERAAIVMPRRMAQRPKFKGLPIPYTTFMTDEGVPDFRVTDHGKWQEAVLCQLCALCGVQLGVNIFFIGGEGCFKMRLFFDPGMHKDCAEYAYKVCPFLARSDWDYSNRPMPKSSGTVKVAVIENMSDVRPEKMGLFRTHSYAVGMVIEGEFIHAEELPDNAKGDLLIRAGEFDQVTWM